MDEDLRLFIKIAIPSVWALEVLLLLRRNRERDWTAAAVTRELRSHETLVVGVLNSLVGVGLVVERDDGYAYAPAGRALDDLATRLEQAYRERPVRVINAIHTTGVDSLQRLADAFRFKGKRDR